MRKYRFRLNKLRRLVKKQGRLPIRSREIGTAAQTTILNGILVIAERLEAIAEELNTIATKP